MKQSHLFSVLKKINKRNLKELLELMFKYREYHTWRNELNVTKRGGKKDPKSATF